MSIERVRALAQRLPQLMSDQVLGYAESVEMALPEIFEEARVPFDERVAGEVVMVAGIRKLEAICSSTATLLRQALDRLAAQEIATIQVGSSEYTRTSRDYLELIQLSENIRTLLRQLEIEQYMTMGYRDIVRDLTDGRREG